MTVYSEKAPIQILILVFPGFLLLDATGPAQVFATANDECHDRGLAPAYAIHLVSASGGAVPSSTGLTMQTQTLPPPSRLTACSLIVAGGPSISAMLADEALHAWIAMAAGRARRCASVCTGAFLLAAAGLLAGKRAITHWKDLEQLQSRYPEIQVRDDAIFLKDGAIYTSGGITAGLDLCIALVEEDLGKPIAQSLAKRLLMFHTRPGDQRQFSAALLGRALAGGTAERLTAWLRPRLQEEIDLERMADAMAMSVRSLHRHLRDEAHLSPAQLLGRIRIEAACAMLEGGNQPLKRVADMCGFGSEYNLRRHFVLQMGVLPSDYRARFS